MTILSRPARLSRAACCAMLASACATAGAQQLPAAGLTGSLTFTTDYVFRGVTQTNNRPALQGALEYVTTQGFYGGLFASNVSWPGDAWEPVAPGVDPGVYGGDASISSSLETRFYAGVRAPLPRDFRVDAGVVHFHYPGRYEGLFPGIARPNTTEGYVAAGWRWFTAGVWQTLNDSAFMISDATGTRYFNVRADFPLGGSGFSATAAVGYWDWNGANAFLRDNYALSNSVYNLTDYRVAVSRDWAGFSWSATFTGSTARKTAFGASGFESAVWGNRFGSNVGDQTFFVSVRRSF
jgi:uncharacterized protein (TIGR02001 family)